MAPSHSDMTSHLLRRLPGAPAEMARALATAHESDVAEALNRVDPAAAAQVAPCLPVRIRGTGARAPGLRPLVGHEVPEDLACSPSLVSTDARRNRAVPGQPRMRWSRRRAPGLRARSGSAPSRSRSAFAYDRAARRCLTG